MTLPSVSDPMVSWIIGYLNNLAPANRPRTVAAKVCAFAVYMHLQGREWPTRPAVARHLGISEIGLDVVLHRSRSLLRRVVEYKPNRTLHVVPSHELTGVVIGGLFCAGVTKSRTGGGLKDAPVRVRIRNGSRVCS